jgi:ribosomal protein S18 acetylase RimI-like enzyme
VVGRVRVELGGIDLARSCLDGICAVYREVFSAPPFFWRPDEAELHRQRLERLLADPSFAVTLAFVGDELVGFAYGYTTGPDSRRWSRLVQAPSAQATTDVSAATTEAPAGMTAEWPGRTFVLFDFAVREPYRGRGVGRALHDALLGSRSEQRATLSVEPQAVQTKAVYQRWGWREVGQVVGGPTAAAPLFDVYVRDSLDDLRPSGPAASGSAGSSGSAGNRRSAAS